MKSKAYAKINLALKITGTLSNGFHSLDMVNLPVDLCDDIELSIIEGNNSKTIIECDALPDLPQESNLCYKAVELLRSLYRFQDNVYIRIDKNIPCEAGLGGGSSDAASVIEGLNSILKLKIASEEMDNIATKIGSDTPYFFRKCACRLTGVGDNITPIENNTNLYCLLVKPKKGLSTKEVYRICDSFKREKIGVDEVCRGLKDNDLSIIEDNFGNDLLSSADFLLPEIHELIEDIKSYKAKIVGMSGSGSTVFALDDDYEKLEIAKEIYGKEYFCCLVRVL